MAASRLAILSLFLALICNAVRADVSIQGEDVPVASDGGDSSAIKFELERLKSKIHSLESHADQKTRELKGKEEAIVEKEKVIQEKSDIIAFLQEELLSFQGTIDATEQVVKAYARAGELEKQIENLKKESEKQQREKDALEARAAEAEDKLSKLQAKLENILNINEEQKSKIRKTERALKIAEEEMVKAKIEATSTSKDLKEAHGAWLPHWLAVHLLKCQSFIETHWNEHGKPAMDITIQKALDKKAQAEKWAEPRVEKFKTKWVGFTTNVAPHVQSLKTKTIETYKASKTVVTPHMIKVQEAVDPYFQEAKRFCNAYIDQVATVANPHVDNVRVALKPYTKKIVHAYGKFLKSATTYHHLVQASVQEILKKNELTRPLATRELEWFAASALLALPIIFSFRMCSAIFCKKAKKSVRHAHYARRKAKRGHPDK